jgi:hypothetical protein
LGGIEVLNRDQRQAEVADALQHAMKDCLVRGDATK